MNSELGIARCGLACCLCSENTHCAGCDSVECPDKDRCENRKCSLERKIGHCYKIADWQEAYKDRLNKEYIQLLSEGDNPAEENRRPITNDPVKYVF